MVEIGGIIPHLLVRPLIDIWRMNDMQDSVIVMMKKTVPGEYEVEVVDCSDLRAFNEACDWEHSTPTHLIRIETQPYALVYVETDMGFFYDTKTRERVCQVRILNFDESERAIEDAQYAVERHLAMKVCRREHPLSELRI